MASVEKKTSSKGKLAERKVRANDPAFNSSLKYKNNFIRTSKYTIATFLPKNLLYQFSRAANFYFLCIACLQVVPAISPLSPITTFLPLCVVLTMSAIKEAFDDYYRHKSDNTINNIVTHRLSGTTVSDLRWQQVVVGDILMMRCDERVPADLLLLSSSEANAVCYVETAELDGETNLKCRHALPEIAEMGMDLMLLSKFNGELISEPPNNNLTKYEGAITWKTHHLAVDNEHILYRGCTVRNTQWCFGLVVFAGFDTKLMQNSGKSVLKITKLDKMMNILVFGIFLFLLLLGTAAAIGGSWFENDIGYFFTVYLPWENPPGNSSRNRGAQYYGTLKFFSYVILMNVLVPISLYVSVEGIRLTHSLFINWDRDMYCAKTNTAALARTTTLNEELGQIQYIFSDKTGTLTQNVMTFNKCVIKGTAYGDFHDTHGNQLPITEDTPQVDFSANPFYQKEFVFYDERLLVRANSIHDEDARQFFMCLSLCHNAMVEEKNGKLEYQAQSPDEAALLAAARNFGYVFKGRSSTAMNLRIHGVNHSYKLLHILEFDNVRKCMSVVLQIQDKVIIYTKGADSAIISRLMPEEPLVEETKEHLSSFAQDGLRTLCLSYRILEETFYQSWEHRYHEASVAVQNREKRLNAVFEEVESQLSLIGATAIEDKLQDGVPDTIACLALANIKIWVLTGDKQETAINIGFSCRLLTPEMEEIFVIDAVTHDGVVEQLYYAYNKLKVTEYSMNSSNAPGYALIVNGNSLAFALKPEMEKLLLEAGCLCKAVICCRVTPLQKAKVVDLVKRFKNSTTLSIGDGANDVSMIKVAHIGVGISGNEGMQAVLASDYAIAQFRYLEKLLLVHGRWSYLRITKFMKYFFYKNFSFALIHLWYAFYCGFSAQSVFSTDFITLYNVMYTFLPVMAMGIFEKDVSAEMSLRYPKLYYPGQVDLYFNKLSFFMSLLEGFFSSVVLFYIPLSIYGSAILSDGKDAGDFTLFGTALAYGLVLTVTFRCALETTYWTVFTFLAIFLSIASIFVMQCLIDSPLMVTYRYYEATFVLFTNTQFWLSQPLILAILILPVYGKRFYDVTTTPRLINKIQLKQRHLKDRELSVTRSYLANKTAEYAFKETQAVLNRARAASLASSAGVTTAPTKVVNTLAVIPEDQTPSAMLNNSANHTHDAPHSPALSPKQSHSRQSVIAELVNKMSTSDNDLFHSNETLPKPDSSA